MEPRFNIIYYTTLSGEIPFSKFLDSLDKRQQTKIIRDFQYVKEYGLDAIRNHIKKLTGTPLWEIRIIGKDSIRIIYVLPEALTMVVLHGFIKKKQKTPKIELEKAIERYKDWMRRNH